MEKSKTTEIRVMGTYLNSTKTFKEQIKFVSFYGDSGCFKVLTGEGSSLHLMTVISMLRVTPYETYSTDLIIWG